MKVIFLFQLLKKNPTTKTKKTLPFLTVAVDIHPRSCARGHCPQLLLTIRSMRTKTGSDLPVELPRTHFLRAVPDYQSLLELFNI